MKILVIDAGALALEFCMRSQEEGHEVVWFIRDNAPYIRKVGEGLVRKTSDWRRWMRWADLIFTPDNAVYMRDLQPYHDQGYPIYGATHQSAEWEMNRGAGMRVFERCGIKTLAGQVFDNYDVAIQHVEKTMQRFVSKPSGDADKALSYVSKSPEDMIYMLERWKKLGKLKAPFILQPFVAGVEMAVGVWMGPHGFASPWCENFEFKKLMNDDLGCATGEQGTVLMYTTQSKLAEKVLVPCEEALIQSGHMGYVDVNCIIDDKGTPWPLEWTNRPGWPHFNIVQPLHRSTASWMKQSLDGSPIAQQFKTKEISTGVVVSMPDYPYGKMSRAELLGVPLYGYQELSRKQRIAPCELMLGTAPVAQNGKIVRAPQMMSAGSYLAVVTGTGRTVTDSTREAYQNLGALRIPNSPMWRTDIGKRLEKQLPKLHRMGYASAWKY